jgi:mannose-6-phosphate isomerase-like protein (cupin superfamily)
MTRPQCVWIRVHGALVLSVALGLIPRAIDAQGTKIPPKNLLSHVMKSADVDAALAKIQDSWDLYIKTNHAVTFRVSSKKLPRTSHPEADEYWFVRRGTAKVALQTGDPASSAPHDVAAGDVVYIPRTIAYDIDPAGRFEYVAVRVFAPRPEGRGAGAGRGGGAAEPISYVASKAQIDRTFANEPSSVPLRFPGGGSLNQVIYNGSIGPYESHEAADQIYVVRHGTARAIYDGRMVDPKVVGPGQIRGTGAVDGSEYTIAAGDIVFIPRNTLHFVDPGTGRIGYFLVGLPTSQSAFTPPANSGGRGGRGQ